jgi:hypothetical protein
MGRGRRAGILLAALFLGACGTLLDISPDTVAPADAAADGGDENVRATGGPCVFDDPGSKLSDVCGFGP